MASRANNDEVKNLVIYIRKFAGQGAPAAPQPTSRQRHRRRRLLRHRRRVPACKADFFIPADRRVRGDICVCRYRESRHAQ